MSADWEAQQKRTVWLIPNLDIFEPRCGRCGKYKDKEDLREHWFFNGIYCVTCIIDILYGNVRTLEEMK